MSPCPCATHATLLAAKTAVKVAKSWVPVLLGPVRPGVNEASTFSGEASRLYRIGLDQVGIELILADQLAEAVTDLGATVVSNFRECPGRAAIPDFLTQRVWS